MLWAREENILRHYLFGNKTIENCESKFRRKLKFKIYLQKTHIYRRVHKFQATGSVNNLN